MENVLKPCPFCRKKVEEGYPYLLYHERMKKWVFNHNCPAPRLELSVCITLYGDTKEEIIERWNGRGKVKKS